jgi:hypothetical protein
LLATQRNAGDAAAGKTAGEGIGGGRCRDGDLRTTCSIPVLRDRAKLMPPLRGEDSFVATQEILLSIQIQNADDA